MLILNIIHTANSSKNKKPDKLGYWDPWLGNNKTMAQFSMPGTGRNKKINLIPSNCGRLCGSYFTVGFYLRWPDVQTGKLISDFFLISSLTDSLLKPFLIEDMFHLTSSFSSLATPKHTNFDSRHPSFPHTHLTIFNFALFSLMLAGRAERGPLLDLSSCWIESDSDTKGGASQIWILIQIHRKFIGYR